MKRNSIALFFAAFLLFSGANKVWGQPTDTDPLSPVMLGLFPVIQAPTDNFDILGLKLNLLYSQCDDFTGLDLGIISYTSGYSRGLHINAINALSEGGGLQIHAAGYTSGYYRGIQFGLFNSAEDLSGLQIGVINIANTLYGLQIGLVNVIRDNDFPFLPIINWYF